MAFFLCSVFASIGINETRHLRASCLPLRIIPTVVRGRGAITVNRTFEKMAALCFEKILKMRNFAAGLD